MDISRETAWKVLCKHVREESLIGHCVAVESCLRAYARKFGENEEYWGAVGLLHDVDFEKFPAEHPAHTAELLLPEGYSEQFVEDIAAHARDWPQERTLLQKSLYAVDALSGFIIACSLVRPDKSIANVQVRSVLKKLKDKTFAKAVNRDIIQEGAALLEIELPEHIDFLIKALADHEKQ